MKNLITKVVLAIAICYTMVALGDETPEPSTEQTTPEGEFVWLEVSEGRIGARAYVNPDLTDRPSLVIVLHGDLLRPDDTYHYDFAQRVAARTPDTIVVGLLRPGYSDEQGNQSDGDRLTGTGDNYTADVVGAVASATKQVRARYGAGTTVMIGHSGGAAIAALVLGRHPDVADAALLVGCPCDLPDWRAHMASLRPHPVWQQPHQGLSPMDFVSGVRSTSIVELLVGDQDDVVRPEYSQDYVAALRDRNVEANATILHGLGHNILHNPKVIGMARELIGRMRTLNQ